ncbi:MAG TPA: DUF4389 domain-containing protein [Gaiellaceae bacterium]|nr:DUF4389 domain-containing protein [Gaiellaceae bacterium]
MTVAPADRQPPRRGMSGGRIALIVLGSLAALVAIGFLVAGGALLWLHQTQRDDDGYFTSSTERFESDGFALTSDGFDIASEASAEDAPDWLLDEGRLATVRVRAEAAEGGETFVGIGPEEDVGAYLEGVPYDEVEDVDLDPFRADYRSVDGTGEPEPPGEQAFWAVSASGPGTQEVEWPLEEGRWAILVMNADAARGVAVDLDLGAKVSFLVWLAIGLLIAGALLLAVGALMIALGARPRGGEEVEAAPAVPPAPLPAETMEGAEPYPVSVEGVRDAELNRWLPLVKWLLVIPHAIILAFLWIAFFVLTIVAGFAILFTERYPRAIFDFNVGVLRWTWRVLFYAYGALATDRYPPFSLGAADYPAVLDVPYPERLSRGLVLVKWWLLAIPHYLVVGALVGGGAWSWGDDGWWWAWWGGWWGGGLIGALALVAGIWLVLFARYPSGVFDLLLGLNRWVFRVAAYAGLMRDEYPPFRLGR